MTKYASSDIVSFVNGQCPAGGHQRRLTNPIEVARGAEAKFEGERLVVTCPVCEPLLTAKDSWSADPLHIPLTPKETAEADALVKEGMKHSALMAQALAELAAERIAAG